MEILLPSQPWLSMLMIFGLRVVDMTLDTLRVLVVMRGQKKIAWVLGFFQASVFVIAIGTVLKNLDNPLNIIGYAAGFATGNVVGMLIEEKMAIGHTMINIVSPRRGSAIADNLRKNGYAVTEIAARGKDGMVTLLNCNVLRRNIGDVRALVNDIDPEAFITSEDIRPIRRGFWRA
jgi:uncharacterized protein YebE (UPF0316 family)